MNNKLWLAAALTVALNGCSQPRDAASVLRDAQEAMGNPTSIQYPAPA